MGDVDWFPLWLSLRVAVIATLISLIFGLGIAWALVNRPFPGRSVADALLTLPLVLPPTVLGYYLLLVVGRRTPFGRVWESMTGSPLVFTAQAAMIAATVHSAPLLIKMSRAALESVDPHFERAGRSLGIDEFTLFWRVTLPLAWRPIAAAAALCFARSLGDFGITLMLAGSIPGRTQTVSVAIYQAVESGNGQVARVLVLAVSAIAVASLSLANALSSRAGVLR